MSEKEAEIAGESWRESLSGNEVMTVEILKVTSSSGGAATSASVYLKLYQQRAISRKQCRPDEESDSECNCCFFILSLSFSAQDLFYKSSCAYMFCY